MTAASLHIRILGCIITAASLLTACSHKEIMCPGNDPHPAEVRFMWDNAPGASVNGMTTYFYPLSQSSRIWRFDIAGSEGGPIELPLGHYRLIAINNDLPGITLSSTDNADNLCAEARRAGSGNLLSPTGMLYCARVPEVELTLCGVSYRLPDMSVKDCPYGLIRCYPDSVTTLYDLNIHHLTGTGNMRSIQARINGVARSIKLASGRLSDSIGSVSCPITPYASSATRFTGSTTAMGIPDSNASPYLTFNVTRTDGSVITKSVGIAALIASQRHRHHIIISIDSLNIPEGSVPPPSDDDDVGIDVGVDGWNVIEIDIGT